MVSVVRQISESDGVDNWAEAEAGINPKSDRIILPPDMEARRKARALTANDRVVLANAIKKVRGPMLNGLLNQGATWHEVDFPVADLGIVRVVDGWDCPEVVKLAELLIRKPEFCFPVYDPALQYGLPVLVGPALTGKDWCLAEGTHRCLTRLRDKDVMADPVRLITVTWPAAKEWIWWKYNRDRSPR